MLLSVLKFMTFKYVQIWFRNCPEFTSPEAFIKSIQNDTPVELEFPNKLGPRGVDHKLKLDKAFEIILCFDGYLYYKTIYYDCNNIV